MKKLFIFIYITLISSNLFSQNFEAKTEIIQSIPFLYDDYFGLKDFNEGMVSVYLNKKWSFIDKSGNKIFDYEQDEYHNDYPYEDFHDGFSIVRYRHYSEPDKEKKGTIDEKCYYINMQGQKISEVYNYASSFSNGLACIEYDNWRGLVDKNFNKVLSCNCKNSEFKEGLLKVEIKQNNVRKVNTGFIDKFGNLKLALDFFCEECYVYDNKIIVADGTNINNNIYSLSGLKQIPYKNIYIYNISDNMCLFSVLGERDYKKYYNFENGKLIDLNLDDARNFNEGLAGVKINGKWGYIDKKGKFIIQPIYDDIGEFKKGYSPVKIKGKWGIIDNTGKMIISFSPIYDLVEHFTENLFRANIKGKWGVIDLKANTIIPFKYAGISDYSDGFARVVIENSPSSRDKMKIGLIDKFGNEIIPCIYEQIGNVKEGMALVKMNGKIGYFSINN